VTHDVGNTAVSVENMLDAGNTKITDLLSVTPPAIPQGAHTITQLDELPRRTPDLPSHRHSGPVFGSMLEGRMLFELEGAAPRESTAGEAFWEPGGEVVAPSDQQLGRHGLEPIACSMHLRCRRRHDHDARGKEIPRAILCGIPALADTGTEDMQAIIARERAAGVDGLAVAEVTYPHAAENDVLTRVHTAGLTRVYSTGRAHGPTASRDRTPTIPGYRDRLEIRSGEPLLKSPGDLS